MRTILLRRRFLGTIPCASILCSDLKNTFLNSICSLTVLGGYHMDSYCFSSFENKVCAQAKQMKKNCLELVGLGRVLGKNWFLNGVLVYF